MTSPFSCFYEILCEGSGKSQMNFCQNVTLVGQPDCAN